MSGELILRHLIYLIAGNSLEPYIPKRSYEIWTGVMVLKNVVMKYGQA